MSVESIDEKAERIAAAMGISIGVDVPFALVPVGDLDTSPVPPHDFLWEGLVPAEVVTLLAAHGGVGKSFLGLMLCVAVAFGLPLFGLPIRQSKTLFFSAEDGALTLRQRLKVIAAGMGVTASDLSGRVFPLDATAGDARLYTEGRNTGQLTKTYNELRDFMRREEIGLVVVDNASDTFDGSEVDRAKVRAFMRALTTLARENNAGCVLLAHVDKATSRGDRGLNAEGYSGSTAWHNSARSRVFMRREADGCIVLEHQKGNLLAGLKPPIRLSWPKNGILTVYASSSLVQNTSTISLLLKMIDEFTGRGEHISPLESSRNNAFLKLSREPTFPKGMKRSDLFSLLRGAERDKYLCRSTIRTQDRKYREVWEVTPAGKVVAGIAPTAPSAPTVEVNGDGAGGAPCAPTPRGVWGESAHASSLRDGTDDAHVALKSEPAEELLDGCSDALCDTSAHDYRDGSAAALACPSA